MRNAFVAATPLDHFVNQRQLVFNLGGKRHAFRLSCDGELLLTAAPQAIQVHEKLAFAVHGSQF